ncbi:MAG: DUF3488 and transglutaminase-like domain-containing protein [Nocardioides sp.]|uniref:transglutaminase family protein n=1 Tax=Nocardioides sp. TaxID=35761 RepID=UPI003265A06C
MNRQRAPLPYTLGLAGVAAATTWFTLLSWGTFTTDPAQVNTPLFFIGAMIAGIGGVTRWLRLPLAVALVLQVVLGAMFVLGSTTGSIVPTPTTIDEFVTAFADAIASAQAFAAPIPPGVPPVTVILLTGGVATLIVVDLLAAALRRIPLAGLALLSVYSVPVSITGDGASWFTFIAMSVGFLSMLYLVHAEQVERWGRGMRNEGGGDADPSSFGVRTGAVRGSALAIGTTATAMALALPLLVPTLEVTLFEGNGPGTKKIEVADPMVDLRRDLNRGQDIPLMWVTTPEKDPSYFRLAVLTRFNGNTWTPGDRDIPPEQVARGDMPALTGVADGTNRTETPYHVRVSGDFESGWLPTTPQVSKMTVIGDWRYDRSTMDFMNTDGDTSADMTYSFTGVEVEPDPALMDNSVSGAASVRSIYTEVPGSISSEIRTLAASVTGGEVTRFRKARALQQWFREDGGFEYSDESIDDDPGSLAAFLDESGRVGYCEQFAASMAIMARIIGIPARVAVGFLDSKPAGANQYEFSAHDLHAWPELYFPGAGWVRFEPTPGARAETVPSYTSAELAPIASESPSTSAAVPEDQLPDRGASPDTSDASATDDGTSIPWVTIVLVTLGVLLLVGLVLLPSFVRRKRRDRRLLGDIEELWLELRDHAVDLGRGWPHGRSPRATGAWLADWFGAVGGDATVDRPRHGAEQNPDAVSALDRLVEQIERARYSRSGASVDHEQASSDVRTIEEALDHGVGPRVRRRARWLPRSLRPSPYVPAGEIVTREMSDSVS